MKIELLLTFQALQINRSVGFNRILMLTTSVGGATNSTAKVKAEAKKK